MIRIDNNELTYKDGYFIINQIGLTGKDSKNPNTEFSQKTLTYPSVSALVCGLDITSSAKAVEYKAACKQLKDNDVHVYIKKKDKK